MISGTFLNEEQKKIKQKIMEQLMDVIDSNIELCQTEFDGQAFMDLMFSILIIFNRETLVQLFSNSNVSDNYDIIGDCLTQLFGEMTKQIMEKIIYINQKSLKEKAH